MWLHFKRGWECRAPGLSNVSGLPKDEQLKESKKLVKKLSKWPVGFELWRTAPVPAALSRALPSALAFKLWQELNDQGLTAVIIDQSLLEDSARLPDYPESLSDPIGRERSFARQTPAHALWAQLEAARMAWTRHVRRKSPSYGGFREHRAQLRRANGQPLSLPADMVQPKPGFFALIAPKSLRLRVFVIDGDSSEVPIFLRFGSFNQCPDS